MLTSFPTKVPAPGAFGLRGRILLCGLLVAGGVPIAMLNLMAETCVPIKILRCEWSAVTSSLDITFESIPGKQYGVYGGENLQTFAWLFDVMGAAGSSETTVSGPTGGMRNRFYQVVPKKVAPAKEWFTAYNGDSSEESHGHYIMTCEDGGFLQVGESGFIPDGAKLMVVKTDSSGSEVWKKEFGTTGHNLGNSCLEVSDGYLIAGALNQDSVLLKLNKMTGATIFSETVNNGGSDAFEHLALTSTGILAVGYVNAEDGENTFFTEGQGYLTFLNNSGVKTSGQSLNSYMAHAYRIKPHGNDYIVAGLTDEALDYAVIKMTATGTVLWNKTFGGSDGDHCFGMDVGDEGSIFLTGHTLSGTANWDTYTMKLDGSGTKVWEVKRGQPRGFDPNWIHDETWGVRATCDGGCIISAGSGDEYPYSDCDEETGLCSDQWVAYVIKFDADGNVDWEAAYASEIGYDWAGEDVDLTPDGGAIIAVDNGHFGFLKLAPF